MNVISLCIWGPEPAYWGGIEAIVKGHYAVWGRGWQLRIHHDDTLEQNVYGPLAKALHAAGIIKLVHAGENCDGRKARAMLWRMKPVWDHEVNICCCRDMDSCPVIADRWCVEDFLAVPGLIAHGINDAPSHNIALMGGMSTFRTKPLLAMLPHDPNWETFAARCKRPCEHGGDQELLWEHVQPRVESGWLMVHKLRGVTDHRKAIMYGEPVWRDLGLNPNIQDRPFRTLMNHLGAAGYNVERAVEFYNLNGDKVVNAEYDKIAAACPLVPRISLL